MFLVYEIVLNAQDNKTLASWWSILNRHEWPEGLDELIESQRWPIMCWIEDKIGRKECLRDWNKERMSDEEFEKWWRFVNVSR